MPRLALETVGLLWHTKKPPEATNLKFKNPSRKALKFSFAQVGRWIFGPALGSLWTEQELNV